MPISVRNGLFFKVWLMLCMGLGALGIAVPAFAQTTTYSNTNATTGGAINDTATPCAAPLVRNFVVGTSYTVSDVDIGALVTHSYRGDLQMTLQSPAGTRVRFFNQGGGSADNYNVMVNDEGGPSVNADTNPHTTTAPPYPNNFSTASPTGTVSPDTPLSVFDGQNSLGTWRLEICDNAAADFGDFLRADLLLTQLPTNYADLSLTKAVSNATPANGAAISYTLAVTNAAASPQTANGVTVRDSLPPGVTFVSATGFGSYNSATGVWTVGSIPAGTTRTLTINVTVSASSGATVTNGAEVSGSSIVDIDSTPGNGSTIEDDDAFVSFTVSGTRVAGTAPTLSCPAGSSTFDWDGRAWGAGSLFNSYSLTSVGPVGFSISSTTILVAGSPALNTNLTGGIPVPQQSLFINMNNNAQSDVSTTVIGFLGAVPGLQFRLFDVDFGSGSYADKITVTGSFNGLPVTPTLTNGTSNYVAGNVAIGDAGATDTTDAGNVTVTFSSPVDTVTVVYGNHTTAPANPGNQWMSIHDMTTCNPVVSLGMTKVSSVFNDGVSPQFFIPGNDVVYTIALSNTASGSVTDDTVFLLDPLPSNVTFFNGDADGSGPGTTPVIFTNNGSGLTFNYATDVRYATTAPANFAACTYTPTAGYDANVRYICVNPKGRMTGQSGATAPSFSISFRAKIN
jgi:uncharacterized repeat protein (TIGR01451 family)